MIELSVRTENKDAGARHRRRYITRNIKSDANPVDPRARARSATRDLSRLSPFSF